MIPRSSIEKSHPTLAALTLAALGVVYGDIGTSPLYAIREALGGSTDLEPTRANVLGILSLVVWALVIVVSVKYLLVLVRVQARGGILGLVATATPRESSPTGRRALLIGLGVFGAALLYGDGVITPAISVLSAVEGLEVAVPGLESVVLPLTVGILVTLFSVQRFGTARVGAVFGPVTLAWFLAIGAADATRVARDPEVLRALAPWHGARFLVENGTAGFLVLGAVVLAVTGVEALYADIGHFGVGPIRVGWFGLVFPALLLNYFGQGAFLLATPRARNPFYELLPEWSVLPMVGLATAATIIASQALITGSFSLTQRAVQLGYLPRFRIVHTSAWMRDQIYVPAVNAFLMVACVGLVLGFRETTRLAAAYGMAVSGTMAITSVLLYTALRQRGWGRLRAAPLAGIFLAVDLAFVTANGVKFSQGAWFPLAVAAALTIIMTTWRAGREAMRHDFRTRSLPFDHLFEELERYAPPRAPGTAVFLSTTPNVAPPVLLNHLRHNHSLHERVVVVTVVHEPTPEVAPDRLDIEALDEGLTR